MKTQYPSSFQRLPKTYEGLCRLMLPRPIHDRVGLENATEIIDLLAGHDLNPEQEDYLDLLSDLVADYEDAHDPVKTKPHSPAERLRVLLESSGMNGSALSQLLDADRTLGNKILRGERQLTVEHLRKLTSHFRVGADYFI
jgi:HTH-type transcriptional regulator/antitoxin HigA